MFGMGSRGQQARLRHQLYIVGGVGTGLRGRGLLAGGQNRAGGGTTGEAKVLSGLWTSLMPFSNFILSILLKKLM